MTDAIGTPRPVARPAAPSALLLLAHGSRVPEAKEYTRALARAVGSAWAGRVEVAYLRHTRPTARQALSMLAEAGHEQVAVVPLLLLSSAFHSRVDLPKALSNPLGRAPLVTPVMGGTTGEPDKRLVAALRRRLAELDVEFDAVVLVATGSTDVGAYAEVTAMASALGTDLGLPCRAAFAATTTPTPGEAAEELRRAGARRIAVASYCLASGVLYRETVEASTAAGVVGVSQPLGDAPELVELVLERLHQARDAKA
ncbi:sirohydrochlorin chelatase [Kitasatospora sp. CB02891]|uniref:sirohydrochlorin chelatase n=1 Tax=Kitasatospora sp. CB02891 TaxID=2020329 RepID=UPI0018E1F229|nr:CbiX/SirB N-terminal domain-containing protein [Kitasatospora sp. CB02891]